MRITRLPLHDNACGRIGNLARQCADNVMNIPPHASMCQAIIYNSSIKDHLKIGPENEKIGFINF